MQPNRRILLFKVGVESPRQMEPHAGFKRVGRLRNSAGVAQKLARAFVLFTRTAVQATWSVPVMIPETMK
jgi:hypothetical protein